MPHDVAEHERRPLEPRDAPERGEVWDDVEVAVALLPACDLVARDRVHLHLEGEEIVAPLDRVLGVHLLDEELPVEPLAHQAALHVRERDDHRVDLARRDERPQLLPAQHGAILCGSPGTRRSSSSISGDMT